MNDDFRALEGEWKELYWTATTLGRFENKYLDSHGGTTGVEHLSQMGKLRSKEEREVIKAKYRRLNPMGNAATSIDRTRWDSRF